MIDTEIGVDCVSVARFNDFKKDNITKLFTKSEIEYCDSKANKEQHYAVRFAAKEAVFKAFSSFGEKINLEIIEIKNKDSGQPFAKIDADYSHKFNISLSLSHTSEIAIAVALVTKI